MRLPLVLMMLLVAAAAAAAPAVDARITPAEIALGQTARLTISTAGNEPPRNLPPDVPGLGFLPIGQSRRVESVNGMIQASFSVTYQVTAQHPGTYVIASIAPGVAPLVLRVDAPGVQPANTVPPVAGSSVGSSSVAPGDVRGDGDASAFLKVVAPTRDIYVGQSIPVEIQVGTQDGLVVSLNGLPTLDGDAFTLDKLSGEPERRSAEIIDGKPYTIFTWHSVLSAIKPGVLSLALQTPLTVRIPAKRPSARFLDDSTLEEVFDDPAFQGFFGGSAQKEVTVASAPVQFNVRELPAENRPADFSGAVGDFSVSSELTNDTVTAGDPVTLRLRVSGEGNFDRVNSAMLHDSPAWKTYRPTSKFTPADHSAFRGDKVFEQPVVPTAPGRQVVPPLTFSYFSPTRRRYETARSEPLTVEVAATAEARAAQAPPMEPAAAVAAGLRPDHAPVSGRPGSLVPAYFEPRFLVLPSALMLAFPGVWTWLRRRERHAADGGRRQGELPDPERLLAEMDRAAAAGDAERFFLAARTVLQRVLANRWQIPPDGVTLWELDTRLGPNSEVRRLFALADEMRYADGPAASVDLGDWRRIVRGQMLQVTGS